MIVTTHYLLASGERDSQVFEAMAREVQPTLVFVGEAPSVIEMCWQEVSVRAGQERSVERWFGRFSVAERKASRGGFDVLNPYNLVVTQIQWQREQPGDEKWPVSRDIRSAQSYSW